MSENNKSTGSKSNLPLILSIILLTTVVASYFLIPDVKNFIQQAYHTLTSEDEERISAWVEQLGIWGPLFIIVIMSLQMFLLVIPSPLIIVISILAYGPVIGSILSIIAVAVASTLGFFIGKYLGESFISKLIGKKKEMKMTEIVNRYGTWAVFITRITPVISNDAISFASGILKMKYLKFISATLAGITPLTLLIAYFGQTNERLKWGLIWVSIISLVLLMVYIIYDRKMNSSQ